MGKTVYYVVRGARMKCSKGSISIRINLPVSHGSYVNGKPIMVKTDNVEEENIGSFGLCLGQKCKPLTLREWTLCKEDTLIDGKQALLKTSLLFCAKGGIIEFLTDGQND